MVIGVGWGRKGGEEIASLGCFLVEGKEKGWEKSKYYFRRKGGKEPSFSLLLSPKWGVLQRFFHSLPSSSVSFSRVERVKICSGDQIPKSPRAPELGRRKKGNIFGVGGKKKLLFFPLDLSEGRKLRREGV